MHRIHRLILDVGFRGSERAGVALQRRVSGICRESNERVLAEALEPFDSAERVTTIERLDVDLGTVLYADLESALTSSLRDAIAARLTQDHPVPHGVHRHEPPAEGALREPDDAEVVLHFLRHGRLPWWRAGRDAPDLEGLLAAWLGSERQGGSSRSGWSEPRRASFLRDLDQLLRGESRARERLRLQFSSTLVLSVLERIAPELHAQAVQALGVPAPEGTPRERWIDVVIEAALAAVSTFPGRDGALPGVDPLVAAVESRDPSPRGRHRSPGPGQSPGVRSRSELPPATGHSGDHELHEEGLLVDGAGVVLLHPFLPRLFSALDVTQSEELVRPARALLLVHHLATGSLTAGEHELVFAKLLCGIPLEQPIALESAITTEEARECATLLQAVVRHWAALGGTSPDGLRGNFLTRSGRLDMRQDDWLLRVEPRSHDVLLDSLPWGLAHVKLPWMPRLMRVEWTA